MSPERPRRRGSPRASPKGSSALPDGGHGAGPSLSETHFLFYQLGSWDLPQDRCKARGVSEDETGSWSWSTWLLLSMSFRVNPCNRWMKYACYSKVGGGLNAILS